MNQNSKQKERVLNYLLNNKTINPLESWVSLGVYRLSDAIFKLRKDYVIETNIVEVLNKHGEVCRVAEYKMVGEK